MITALSTSPPLPPAPSPQARAVLEEGEAERMFPAEVIAKEAVRLAESDGIVFIDEIDKVH